MSDQKIRRARISKRILELVFFPPGTIIEAVEGADTLKVKGSLDFYISNKEFNPIPRIHEVPLVDIEITGCSKGHTCCTGGVVDRKFKNE